MDYGKHALNLKEHKLHLQTWKSLRRLIRKWIEASVGTPCSCTSAVPVWTWRTGHSIRWGPWESGSGLRLAQCWRSLSRAGISDANLQDALTAAAGSHTQIQTLNIMCHMSGRRWKACRALFYMLGNYIIMFSDENMLDIETSLTD